MRGVDSFESAACLFSFVRSGHDKKVTARFFFQRGMSLYKTFYGVYKKSWGHEKEKKIPLLSTSFLNLFCLTRYLAFTNWIRRCYYAQHEKSGVENSTRLVIGRVNLRSMDCTANQATEILGNSRHGGRSVTQTAVCNGSPIVAICRGARPRGGAAGALGAEQNYDADAWVVLFVRG